MLKDFKAFIMRGNVLDLAVAVIIGGAFGKIVTSFVNDIVMPPIGLLLGRVDFSNLYFNLSGTAYPSLVEAQAAGAPTINYGSFINTVVDFLIVAAVVFLVVRAGTRLETRKPAEPSAPVTKECPYCMSSVPVKATRCAYCTSQL
jgi:large conductance mechanosensitive channel